jgi:hypothetical protein
VFKVLPTKTQGKNNSLFVSKECSLLRSVGYLAEKQNNKSIKQRRALSRRRGIVKVLLQRTKTH